MGRGAAFSRQTIRQVVHTGISGTDARIELSNVFGTAALSVSDVHLAQAGSGSAITSGTDHTVTFGGSSSVTIPAGGTAISDTVNAAILASGNIAISFYLPGPTGASTYPGAALQTSYIASGDVSGAASLSSEYVTAANATTALIANGAAIGTAQKFNLIQDG